jgi:hypothetical protein
MQSSQERHFAELLPWLANETLEGDEHDLVEQHVADCDACRRELVVLRELRSTLQRHADAGAGELGLRRLRRDIHRNFSRLPRWLLPAGMAAALVIAVQSVVLWQTVSPVDRYAPLSGSSVGGGVLQATFSPQAREADLRALLRESGVRIVDGPSAAGVYRLAVDAGQDPEQVVQTLKRHPGLIRHAALE